MPLIPVRKTQVLVCALALLAAAEENQAERDDHPDRPERGEDRGGLVGAPATATGTTTKAEPGEEEEGDQPDADAVELHQRDSSALGADPLGDVRGGLAERRRAATSSGSSPSTLPSRAP